MSRVPHRPDHASGGGRAVVVVGASSGIGLATAQHLSALGDRLVLVARDETRLREVAASLPGPTEVAVADLVDTDQVTAAVEACVAAYGRVDAVVTSAQPMAYGTVEQVPTDVLLRLTDVAVGGVSRLAQAALPHFRAQPGGGHLVVVNSLLAEISVPSMGAYCSAKSGQLALVRALQLETRRESGVHVSLVLPGAIDTPIYDQAATYAGSPGSAPPPVIGPAAVAEAVVACLERPPAWSTWDRSTGWPSSATGSPRRSTTGWRPSWSTAWSSGDPRSVSRRATSSCPPPRGRVCAGAGRPGSPAPSRQPQGPLGASG